MPAWWDGWSDTARRTAAAHWTVATGRPEIFVPRKLLGPWWEPFGNAEPSSLYNTTPLAATLARLVDLDRLNAGNPRYTATAVDLESGDDAAFDSARVLLTVDHIRASAALLPAFPPVEIDDRLYVDAGLSANLPLDLILGEPPPGPLLCLAVDLLPLAAPRPKTLGEVASRMQDLIFAAQSRRSITAWQRIFALRAAAGETLPAITLVHLAYGDQGREIAGKAFDFSPETIRDRWSSGRRDMAAVLAAIARGDVALDAPGLTVHRPAPA